MAARRGRRAGGGGSGGPVQRVLREPEERLPGRCSGAVNTARSAEPGRAAGYQTRSGMRRGPPPGRNGSVR